MFIKKVPRKNRPSVMVQIVKSYRDAHNRPRQKIMEHVGSARGEEALKALLQVAEVRLAALKQQQDTILFPAGNTVDQTLSARQATKRHGPIPVADACELVEKKKICFGFHEVIGQLYDQLRLGRVISSRSQMSRRLFKETVLLRLAFPGKSKLHNSRHMSMEYGVGISEEKIYRMMDSIDDRAIGRIQTFIGGHVLDLLNQEVNLLFFDVTSLSFASEVSDDLRKKGYSKDGKHHRVQVILALAQTLEGLPVGYSLFAGNTADVSTLKPTIASLKKRVKISRVVVVADAGVLSHANREMLRKEGYEYILAARLRHLGASMLQEVGVWKKGLSYPTGAKEASIVRMAEFEVDQERLILRHCPKRHAKDLHKRNEAVEKAKKNIHRLIKGSGLSSRFIKVEKGCAKVDQEAIDKDAFFDGLHGVYTSLDKEQLSIQDTYAQYRQLWEIENSFRVLKSTMRVRPVYHWKEPRVKAHIAICFTAFALLRILRYRYNCGRGGRAKLSDEQILTCLSKVEGTLLHDPHLDNQFLVPSPVTKEIKALYRTVGRTLQLKTKPIGKTNLK